MLHKLLKIERPLFVLDCESTGLDVQADRIVELGFQRWTAEGMTREWRSLINPGVPIPEAVVKIHGITDNDMVCCQKCKMPHAAHPYYAGPDPIIECQDFHVIPRFKQIAANLAGQNVGHQGFVDCDFAGKNVRFDLALIASEMQRCKQPWSYAGARVIDIDRLEALAVPRDLGSMHEKYLGRKHADAHGALSDVQASVKVLIAQLVTHENLPRDLDLLHRLSWPGWLTTCGRFRMVDGVATCMFGKWRLRAMKDIEPGYYDWLISADFSPEIKALAAEAKLGKFPEETR